MTIVKFSRLNFNLKRHFIEYVIIKDIKKQPFFNEKLSSIGYEVNLNFFVKLGNNH